MRRHSEGLLRQSSFKGVSAPTDRWRTTLRKVISLSDDEKGAGVYGLLDLGTAIDCAARQRGRDFIRVIPSATGASVWLSSKGGTKSSVRF
jgi:hypothetical protein